MRQPSLNSRPHPEGYKSQELLAPLQFKLPSPGDRLYRPEMSLTSEITTWTAEQVKAHGISLEAPPAFPNLPRLLPYENDIPADVKLARGLFIDWVSVTTRDTHYGSGWSFAASEVDAHRGVLSYDSWETLRSAENYITVEAVNEVVTITFYTDIAKPPVGSYKVVVDRASFPKAMGYFTWQ